MNFKKSKRYIMALSSFAVLALAGCKGESENYVESWKIGTGAAGFTVDAVFNQKYEFDGEALIRFKEHGSIYIGQDDQRRFSVHMDLAHKSFGDVDLKPVAGLPSGYNFPNIVTMPMLSTQLYAEAGKWKVTGYWGAQTNPSKNLVGVAIELGSINNNFPVISITQNYFKNDQRFAAFTIYGPKLDENGKVLVPGGIFLVADVNQLIGGNDFKVESRLEISGPDADLIQSEEDRELILASVYQELEAAGLIRKK